MPKSMMQRGWNFGWIFLLAALTVVVASPLLHNSMIEPLQTMFESSAAASRPELSSSELSWPEISQETQASFSYTIHSTPTADVHVVQAHSGVRVAMAEGLAATKAQAQSQGAVVALNAGFFDPYNGQTTSFVTLDGQLAADPRQNRRLMDNPDLAPYLERILNRSEFRRYDCRGESRYDITPHDAPPPAGCAIAEAVGGGPQLLPTNTAVEEAFIAYSADGGITRDALGGQRPNARSLVGIQPDGKVLLVMVAQRQEADALGMDFDAMTTLMQALGADKALNLDGGSSTSLYVDGKMYYGRLDGEGREIHRPVKSILWIAPSLF